MRQVVAGTMCGVERNWGFGSVAALEVVSPVVEAIHSVAVLEGEWVVLLVEVGRTLHAVESVAVVGEGSIVRARSGLEEGRMEEEHIAAEL